MKRGVLTVYLSLVLMLLISLFLVSFESARVYIAENMAQRYADMAGEMLFSAYTKPLADRYGIFVLDAGSDSSNLKWFQNFLEENMDSDETSRKFGLTGEVSDVQYSDMKSLKDDGWESFREQISRYELYKKGNTALSGIRSMIGQIQDAGEDAADNQQSLGNALESKGSAAESEASTLSETNASAETSQTAEGSDTGENVSDQQAVLEQEQKNARKSDPRKGILQYIKQGILSSVMGDRSISSKSADTSSCSYSTGTDTVKTAVTGFASALKVSGEIESEDTARQLSDIASSGEDALMTDLYIQDVFRNLNTEASDSGAESVLEYEQEFILYGHDSDRENLESALQALFNTRLLLNMAYLYKDSGRRSETLALAQALGMYAPISTAVIQLLLIVCWASGESLVDVRSLVDGKKVPLMKSDATWSLTFENLQSLAKGTASLSSFESDVSSGLTYDKYLLIFLLIESENKKLTRMSQLMELNVRQTAGYEDFKFSDSITEARFTGSVDISPVFWNHPTDVQADYQVTYGY